ncbi:hypothetical protein JCM11251_004520 [Rhodosporidiobolus azoricus]
MLRQLVTAAGVLGAVSVTVALSSHSPRDLESHPSFAVVLSEHHLLNESLPDILAQPLETPSHSSPPARHLLRTPNGQSFLCTVPAVTDEAKKRADQMAEEDALIQAEEKERGVAHGVALLEPMRQGCLYQKQGWFTYSFCYGSEIRQFHEIRVANSPGPSEDPQSDSYTLGVAPEPVTSLSPAVRDRVETEMVIPSRLGGGESGGWDEGGRYLSQTWEGGTVCDKTGLPRTVEVQYHCNTQTIDHIALIRETSICRYVLLIHTPRLCGEPLFLDGHMRNQEQPKTIECQPVVNKVQERISSESEAAAGGEGAVPRRRVDLSNPATPQEPLQQPGEETLDRSVDSTTFDDDPSHALQHALNNLEGVFTLVYDAETGEVHGAELEVDDSGRAFLAEQNDGQQERKEEDKEGMGEKVAKENEELTKTLEELAKVMHDTLAAALLNGPDGPAVRGVRADPAVAEGDNAQPPPRQILINPMAFNPALHLPLAGAAGGEGGGEAVRAFVHAIADGQVAAGGAGGAQGNAAVMQKYLELLQGQGQGDGEGKGKRKVHRQAEVRNEAHERLKKGFERKWDEEDDKGNGEKGQRARDEL